MRRVVNTIKKTISIHIEENGECISLDGLSGYIAEGYTMKIFDVKGKELPKNTQFKLEAVTSSKPLTPLL